MTQLRGVALLPQPRDQEALIAWQQVARAADLRGPKLGLVTNQPHLTVMQTHLSAQVAIEATKSLADCVPVRPEAVIGEVYNQAVDWLFVDVHLPPWGYRLHECALAQVTSAIDTTAIDRKVLEADIPPGEKAAHARYGYRYAGAHYRPHITVGVLPYSGWLERASEVRAVFAASLRSRVIAFDRLVAYEAGPRGELRDVLFEQQLL